MPREHTEDEALARQFDCAPEEIAVARENLIRNTLLRKIIAYDLNLQIEALRNTLETVPADKLYVIQGTIAGLRKASGTILKTP